VSIRVIRGPKNHAPKARQDSQIPYEKCQMPNGWNGWRLKAGHNATGKSRKNEKTPQPISFFNPGCFEKQN
jgi:hypothetical protein